MTLSKSRCAIVLALLVSGCSSASTDPHTGGLMGGIAGITTGAYDKRLAEKQTEVAELDAAGDALKARIGSSEARLRDLDKKIAARKSKIERMKADLAEIDRMLKSGAAETAAAKGTLTTVESENKRKAAILAPLKAERDTLQRMVNELEEGQRIEAMNYQKARTPQAPDAAQSTQIVELEKRALELDRKQDEAQTRVAQMKESVAKLAKAG